jgi:protein SCO1
VVIAVVRGARRRLWDNWFMSNKRSALYLIPLLLAAAAAGYMVSAQLARKAPQLGSGTALPEPRKLPAFSLVDQDGAAFGNAQLPGQPTLMFFGFTHCPDVCPTTLAVMAQLKHDESLSALRPVFVTVDPARDDVAALKQYTGAFNAGIVGLRGEDAALAPLLQGMGVAHAIQQLPGGGYTVDHSAALYYLNDRGEWSAAFTPPFTPDKLRQDLAALISSRY